MIISKAELALAKLASKYESRYTLTALSVDAEQTVVTDGHMLMTVQHRLADAGANAGAIPIPILVQASAALAALKAIPKVPKGGEGMRNQYQSATVSSEGTLLVMDGDGMRAEFGQPVKGQFPAWKGVLPRGTGKAEAILNAGLLHAMLEYFADLGRLSLKKGRQGPPIAVRVTIYGEAEPVRLDAVTPDGQEVMGLLMPMRVVKGRFALRPGEEAAEEVAEWDAEAEGTDDDPEVEEVEEVEEVVNDLGGDL